MGWDRHKLLWDGMGQKNMSHGQAWGSDLGPLLFIFYVNGMRNALQTIPRLFADDTCLFLTAKNIE